MNLITDKTGAKRDKLAVWGSDLISFYRNLPKSQDPLSIAWHSIHTHPHKHREVTVL